MSQRIATRRSIALLLALGACAVTHDGWPAAGGPAGDFGTRAGPAPRDFSAARGEGIRWRVPLPEAGQSGICVVEDRVFLSTLARVDAAPGATPRPFSKDILGCCFDAQSGALLWTVEVPGVIESPNLYAYSDASSPTPCSDGERVCFVNAAGGVACCDLVGTVLWRRGWRPWAIEDGFPFNKQFEPFIADGALVNLEPRDAGDPLARPGWNWLRGLDLADGQTRWIAEDGTTSYCTPVLGRTADGTAAVLHGRGGWHGVPEQPVGLSLTSVAGPDAGATRMRYVATTGRDGETLAQPGSVHAPTWQALYVMHWDPRHAYWFVHNPIESHLVIDLTTGAELARQSLVAPVDWRRFDAGREDWVLQSGIDLRTVGDPSPRMRFDPAKDVIVVHPAWHSNLVTHGKHWFLCSTAHGRNAEPNASRPGRRGVAGPSHCLGRVDIASGKVEYLELPVEVLRESGAADRLLWGEARRTRTENARGIDIAAEDRSRTDGWEIPAFWASPIVVGDTIYFVTTPGIVYVVDACAEPLDGRALLAVGDLGPRGETFAMGGLAFADGCLYARTAKELLCIGPELRDRADGAGASRERRSATTSTDRPAEWGRR